MKVPNSRAKVEGLAGVHALHAAFLEKEDRKFIRIFIDGCSRYFVNVARKLIRD